MLLTEYDIVKYTDETDLIDYLESKVDEVTDNEDGTIIVEVDGYFMKIDEDGNIIAGPSPRVNRIGLAVGDYIDYTPDDKTSSPYTKLERLINGGTSSHGSVTQDILNWQILKINADGSIHLIGSPTSQSIFFEGVLGYNNGVYLMNDICKSLYSKNANLEGITARSVNLKDFEYWLKKSTGGVASRDSYNNGTATYNTSKQYTGSNSYRPDIFGKTENESDSYYTSPTTNTYSRGGSLDTLDVKQTYYNMAINEINYGEGYKALTSSACTWVASRYANCSSDNAGFGFHYSGSNDFDGGWMFSTENKSSGNNGFFVGLRPVVSLGPDVQITASETASSSSGTPHTITQY